MDWVDRPKKFKGLYGIVQLLQGSHLDNFPLKTLKLDWVAFHSVTFQLTCLINIRNSSQTSHVSAMGYSFYVISWSYVSAPEFCKKPFMQ